MLPNKFDHLPNLVKALILEFITNYNTNNSNEFNFFITTLTGSYWVQTPNNNQESYDAALERQSSLPTKKKYIKAHNTPLTNM
jgi:hypothetical protein